MTADDNKSKSQGFICSQRSILCKFAFELVLFWRVRTPELRIFSHYGVCLSYRRVNLFSLELDLASKLYDRYPRSKIHHTKKHNHPHSLDFQEISSFYKKHEECLVSAPWSTCKCALSWHPPVLRILWCAYIIHYWQLNLHLCPAVIVCKRLEVTYNFVQPSLSGSWFCFYVTRWSCWCFTTLSCLSER